MTIKKLLLAKNPIGSFDKGVVDFKVATDQPRTKIPGAPD
jgi:hypothetical protein